VRRKALRGDFRRCVRLTLVWRTRLANSGAVRGSAPGQSRELSFFGGLGRARAVLDDLDSFRAAGTERKRRQRQEGEVVFGRRGMERSEAVRKLTSSSSGACRTGQMRPERAGWTGRFSVRRVSAKCQRCEAGADLVCVCVLGAPCAHTPTWLSFRVNLSAAAANFSIDSITSSGASEHSPLLQIYRAERARLRCQPTRACRPKR
jgi:hypothetical protein